MDFTPISLIGVNFQILKIPSMNIERGLMRFRNVLNSFNNFVFLIFSLAEICMVNIFILKLKVEFGVG
jgi:hypothetical protein